EWYLGGRSSLGQSPGAPAPRPRPRRAPGMARAPYLSSQHDSRRKGTKAARRASLIVLFVGVLLAMSEGSGAAAELADEAPPRHVEVKMVAPNESWPA